MSNLRVVGWWLRVVGLWMMMWRCLSLVAPPIADRVSPSRVKVYDDAEAVGAAVCRLVDDAAAAAVEEKGKFVIGIPGGSVLKMLAGSQQPTWSKATTVVWVNHKCVDVSDPALSTRAKATFLEQWPGAHVLDLTGTNDADAEADLYEAKLREAVPVDDQGLPKFDMMLIGAGDDGHIGSLYPDRAEVLRADRWVLPVKMKDPPSITLSLPVMRNAADVIIAACGVSEKYPQGKSDAMKRAVETPESLTSFPAAGLRAVATYCFDNAAASLLSPEFRP